MALLAHGERRRRSPRAPRSAGGRRSRRPGRATPSSTGRGREAGRTGWQAVRAVRPLASRKYAPRLRTNAPHQKRSVYATVSAEPATRVAASSTAAAARTPGAVAAVDQVGQRLERGLLGREAERRRAARPSRPPATIAATGHHGHPRGRRRSARRRSRVPAQWSTMPTTRNSVDLNSACATSSARPPSAAARVPMPHQHHEEAELAHGPVREQHLDVVLPQRPPAAEDHRGRAERQR